MRLPAMALSSPPQTYLSSPIWQCGTDFGHSCPQDSGISASAFQRVGEYFASRTVESPVAWMGDNYLFRLRSQAYELSCGDQCCHLMYPNDPAPSISLSGKIHIFTMYTHMNLSDSPGRLFFL